MDAKQFIGTLLERIDRQYKTLDQTLTTNSVLLRKRLRCMTAQDAIGVFTNRGIWRTVNSKGIHTLNIIKGMVKTAAGAISTAEVAITVNPRFGNGSKSRMVADVCKAIIDQKVEEQWTPRLAEQVATEPQIAPGVFIRVNWNPHIKQKFSLDEWGEEEIASGGKSICTECGYEFEGAVEQCSNCGGRTEVIEEPIITKIDTITNVNSHASGDTDTTVIPASEIVVDDLNTAGGNLQAARWMLHRHLEPESEILLEYPNAPKGTEEWSYPLQWQHALQTGREVPDTDTVDELAEIKDLYLTPQMYLHAKLSEDLIIKDGEQIRFYVPKDGTFADGAFNGEYFEEPPVLCFRVKNGHIIDVYPCDFREEFIYISFLANPSMFYALFLTEMIPLQDIVNYMMTVQVYHTKRNARTTKVLNSGSYDPEDVEKDVVLTKDPLPYDVPISNTYGEIKASTLSNAPMELISLILSTKQDVGGITPAMQGVSAPNETYSAQRQQKEQSLGQLVPFMRSIAEGKTRWAERQCKEAKENWPEERLNFLLQLNPEWTEEYIETFTKSDLDRDVVFGYEQGSEVPRNLFEKEQALRLFMQDVMTLAQVNPNLAKPEVTEEILLRIKQFARVDVDVANTQAEVVLAEARFDKLKSLLDGMEDPGDPMARQIVAMQLIQLPDLMPSMYEDAVTSTEFYRDKITKELSAAEPDFLLITCLEVLIKATKGQKITEMQEDTTLAMAAQQPMVEQQMAQQQMMAEQQAQAQQQASQEQMDQELAKQQVDQSNRQSEMDFEREKMVMDQQNKMADAMIRGAEREHQASLDRSAK